MNENTGKLIGNIIPLIIFIYLSLIMNGFVKPRKEIPLLTNPRMLVKIIVYSGLLVFALLVIFSLLGE